MNDGIHAASLMEKTERLPDGMPMRLWKTSCNSSPYLSTHTVTLAREAPMPATPSPIARASSVSAVHTNVCSGELHQSGADGRVSVEARSDSSDAVTRRTSQDSCRT